jgi:hypothetical protein
MYVWGNSHLFRILRDDPPGQTCSQAVQKLTEFTKNVSSGTVPLEFVGPTKDIHLKNVDILHQLNQLNDLEQKLNDCTSMNIANFEQLVIHHIIDSHIHIQYSQHNFSLPYSRLLSKNCTLQWVYSIGNNYLCICAYGDLQTLIKDKLFILMTGSFKIFLYSNSTDFR